MKVMVTIITLMIIIRITVTLMILPVIIFVIKHISHNCVKVGLEYYFICWKDSGGKGVGFKKQVRCASSMLSREYYMTRLESPRSGPRYGSARSAR